MRWQHRLKVAVWRQSVGREEHQVAMQGQSIDALTVVLAG